MSLGQPPLGYLQTHGPRADPATALTWGLMGLSLAVIVIITALVIAGVLLRRVRGVQAMPQVEAGPGALAWLYIGIALTMVALVASLVWTVAVIARIAAPAQAPALAIEVTGRQWWWAVRYLGPPADAVFETANEIHIPVGRPVLVRLRSDDVIHSFWAPQLTGKTDTIPGRTNVTWLQADQPGTYVGQCTEYCGVQHAHMRFAVIADPPAVFAAWRTAQQRDAAPAMGDGAALFQAHCAACHAVRGTAAGGISGPDLTHLMSRATIASGLLPNQRETLAGWIANPQALKPGTLMPAAGLDGTQLQAVTAYLLSLK